MADVVLEDLVEPTTFDALVEAYDIPVEERRDGQQFTETLIDEDGRDRRFLRLIRTD